MRTSINASIPKQVEISARFLTVTRGNTGKARTSPPPCLVARLPAALARKIWGRCGCGPTMQLRTEHLPRQLIGQVRADSGSSHGKMRCRMVQQILQRKRSPEIVHSWPCAISPVLHPCMDPCSSTATSLHSTRRAKLGMGGLHL